MNETFSPNLSHSIFRGMQAWWLVGPHQTGYAFRDMLRGKKATATGTINSDMKVKWSYPKREAGYSSYYSSDWYWDTGLTTLNSASSYSYSYWGRRNSSGCGMGASSSGTNRDCTSGYYGSNTIYVTVGSGGAYAEAINMWAVADAKWHHFVTVYDGSQATNATRICLYMDGVKLTLAFPGSAIPATSGDHGGNSIYIGRDIGLAQYTRGNIDDVKVWNRPLTPAEAVFSYLDSLTNYRVMLPMASNPFVRVSAASAANHNLLLLGVG